MPCDKGYSGLGPEVSFKTECDPNLGLPDLIRFNLTGYLHGRLGTALLW